MKTDLELLSKKLICRRIVKVEETKITLDDGSVLHVKETAQDCCASAGGSFTALVDLEKADAVITGIQIVKEETNESWGETTNSVVIHIVHNTLPLVEVDCYANDGNGGFYFSTCSFVLEPEGEVFDIVSA